MLTELTLQWESQGQKRMGYTVLPKNRILSKFSVSKHTKEKDVKKNVAKKL